jgi:hypothetical protein
MYGFQVGTRWGILLEVSMEIAIIEFTIPAWAALELEKTTAMFACSQ